MLYLSMNEKKVKNYKFNKITIIIGVVDWLRVFFVWLSMKFQSARIQISVYNFSYLLSFAFFLRCVMTARL